MHVAADRLMRPFSDDLRMRHGGKKIAVTDIIQSRYDCFLCVTREAVFKSLIQQQ